MFSGEEAAWALWPLIPRARGQRQRGHVCSLEPRPARKEKGTKKETHLIMSGGNSAK